MTTPVARTGTPGQADLKNVEGKAQRRRQYACTARSCNAAIGIFSGSRLRPAFFTPCVFQSWNMLNLTALGPVAAQVRMKRRCLCYRPPKPAAVATTSAVSARTVRIFLVGVGMPYSLGVGDYNAKRINAMLGHRLLYSLIVHFAWQIARSVTFRCNHAQNTFRKA